MSALDSDYPFSIFRAIGSYLVARILFLFAAIILAVLLGAGVADLAGDHLSAGSALILYPVLVIGGIAQFHGILAYGLILTSILVYILREASHYWLLVVFGIQAIEAGVWCASWTVGK